MRCCESKMTRTGRRRSSFLYSVLRFSGNSSQRTLRLGSSAITVAEVDKSADDFARIFCTSERASGPVIHLLSPLAIAVRPSKLIASLS